MSNSLRSHSRSFSKVKREYYDDEDDDDCKSLNPRNLVKATRETKSSKDSKQVLPVASTHEDEHNCPDDVPDWPRCDLLELIKRMDSNIPVKDSLSYNCRAEKLNWDMIAFSDYSAGQCKEMWTRIQKRVRRYRLLREVLVDAKDWVNKPWTHFYRSQKMNRHPDLPKRPLSSYMLFYMERKDEVVRQNPGLDMTSVSKRISELYNNLPKNEKGRYVSVAATLRKEHGEKLRQFYLEHPELTPATSNSKDKKKKLTSGLQKPLTPFKLFLSEEINRHTEDPLFDRNAVTEHCKEKWRNMADKKKVVWINWALENEAKYLDELKSLNPDINLSKIKPVVTKEEKNLAEKVAGKPGKPPNSGYSLFSRIMLMSPEIKQIMCRERMNVISRLWKSLNDEEKSKYQEQANNMLDQYKLEYASYLESLPQDKQQEELLNNQPKRKAPPTKSETKQKRKVPKSEKTKSPASGEKMPNLYKGEPPPPPLNMFQLFMREFMENSKNKNMSYTESEVKLHWQALPNEDKEKYSEQFREIKNKYMLEYEKFLKGLTQEELKEYSLHKTMVDSKKDVVDSERGVESDNTSSDSSDKSDSSSSEDSEDSSESESDSDSSSSASETE
ncbi:hypothetical protein PR048_005730 [Dryococelus australis]|uniref:HMG box domain-containing protein n=1 Tax=Dryococelus australis TaxID=614101 RepID=A0ABQ9I8Z8_9NEOP|nr:hypothetical protein PR048_005730 [Dryococelus australis]